MKSVRGGENQGTNRSFHRIQTLLNAIIILLLKDNGTATREKIPREICLQTYRKFLKDCIPRPPLEKRLMGQIRQDELIWVLG